MRLQPSAPSRFLLHLWLTLAVFLLFIVAFVIYVRAEKQIDRANESRLHSFRLADELHQSSDDLTRMVRTYVVTGNPRFKRHFQEIIDIRDGRLPRPEDYDGVYWDLVLAEQAPAPAVATPCSTGCRRPALPRTSLPSCPKPRPAPTC